MTVSCRDQGSATRECSNNSPVECTQEPSSLLWKELKILCSLAIPTIIINLSLVVPPFLTASYVGRNFGHLYLDGYTLANLTGNLLTLAVLQGFDSACDTLAPQAFAASNYREVVLPPTIEKLDWLPYEVL
ncbi:hypothetical protein ACA910_008567 [Epithemia clementina (nom. ined.)]